MSHKHILKSSRRSIESCTSHVLSSWRPFHRSKTLDSSEQPHQMPYASNSMASGVDSTIERLCFYDRSSTSLSIEAMNRLSLTEEDNGGGGKKTSSSNYNKSGRFRLEARNRRRRNLRSVSARSRDRSGTRSCCSDFPFAVSSDSSGELFGEENWGSDVIKAARNSRRRDSGREKEAPGFGLPIGIDLMGNESGYGSELGYRSDVEFGYNGEDDEGEDDVKSRFWRDSKFIQVSTQKTA